MKKRPNKQKSIAFQFAKKYIYFYYGFFWCLLLLYVFTR